MRARVTTLRRFARTASRPWLATERRRMANPGGYLPKRLRVSGSSASGAVHADAAGHPSPAPEAGPAVFTLQFCWDMADDPDAARAVWVSDLATAVREHLAAHPSRRHHLADWLMAAYDAAVDAEHEPPPSSAMW